MDDSVMSFSKTSYNIGDSVDDAVAKGLKYYMGQSCGKKHTGVRFVTTGACKACTLESENNTVDNAATARRRAIEDHQHRNDDAEFWG